MKDQKGCLGHGGQSPVPHLFPFRPSPIILILLLIVFALFTVAGNVAGSILNLVTMPDSWGRIDPLVFAVSVIWPFVPNYDLSSIRVVQIDLPGENPRAPPISIGKVMVITTKEMKIDSYMRVVIIVVIVRRINTGAWRRVITPVGTCGESWGKCHRKTGREGPDQFPPVHEISPCGPASGRPPIPRQQPHAFH